jgi:hypothetical protein
LISDIERVVQQRAYGDFIGGKTDLKRAAGNGGCAAAARKEFRPVPAERGELTTGH